MITVELFIPCFIDQLFPETAKSTVKLLENASCEVKYNPAQTCCGQMFYNSGHWKEAGKSAAAFLNHFSGENYIVSPGASCTSFIKNHYQRILKEQSQLEKLNQIKDKFFELSDFLVNVVKLDKLQVEFPHKVTYHDACSALREYGIKEEPRKLLSLVDGLELIEMEESETCCGFGGTFSIKHEPISTAMAEQKVEFALKTGAEYITSTESSCLMNLQGYIDKHNLPIQTIHIADLLAGR